MNVLTPWWVLSLCVLVAKTAVAQPQPVARQRQDRRASLAVTPAEPMPELYVAAGNLTTVAFNGLLDRDSLVADRTRFKWMDVGDNTLALQPFADLGSGERLIVKIGFKDRSLPTHAVFAVVTDSQVVDGTVEVDLRANTPEALRAALSQKEAELEELKARCTGSGPMGLVLSGWLTAEMHPVRLFTEVSAAETSGLELYHVVGYEGTFSALVAINLRNLRGQKPWDLGQVRLVGPGGTPVSVLAVQRNRPKLEPGEDGLVVLEVKTPPWTAGQEFRVELVDDSGQRRLSFTLKTKRAPDP